MFSLHALQKNVNVNFFYIFLFFQMKQQLVINMLAFFFLIVWRHKSAKVYLNADLMFCQYFIALLCLVSLVIHW